MQRHPDVNRSTNQTSDSLDDLIAPQFNRTRLEPGRDLALSFLPVVKDDGGRGEREGKPEKNSIEQESEVCGVLWSKPGRYKTLQTAKIKRGWPKSHLHPRQVPQPRRRRFPSLSRASCGANQPQECLAKASEPNNRLSKCLIAITLILVNSANTQWAP